MKQEFATHDELWDVYDRDGNPTGNVIWKSEFKAFAKDDPTIYRLAANLWPVNDKGEILLQQRADTLNHFPGYWSMTGGSVAHGETSREAVVRETGEELGLELDPDECIYVMRTPSSRVWIDHFFIRSNIDPRELKLNPAEVKRVMWVKPHYLDYMISQGDFVPARWDFIRIPCILFANGTDVTNLWHDQT